MASKTVTKKTAGAGSVAHPSELAEPRWSVVSFERVEGSGLNYDDAVALIRLREAEGAAGLCLVSDAAAKRMSPR